MGYTSQLWYNVARQKQDDPKQCMIRLIDRSCFADKICRTFFFKISRTTFPTSVQPWLSNPLNCSLQPLFLCRFAGFAVAPHHGHRSPDTWVNINLFLFRLFQHTLKYNKHVHQPISAVFDVDMFWPATYSIPSLWFGCFSFFSSPLLVFFGFVFPFSSWSSWSFFSGWWYTYPSEKYESQIESSSKLLGKLKHVPNHQPDNTMLLSLYT